MLLRSVVIVVFIVSIALLANVAWAAKNPVYSATIPANTDGVSGSVTFQKSCDKGFTQVTVNVLGLLQRAYYWDIRTVSGKLNPSDLCSNVGPLFVGPKLQPVGALSTRLGSWGSENNIVSRTYLDNVISLSGKLSIVRKLLVIHRASDGSNWFCAFFFTVLLRQRVRN